MKTRYVYAVELGRDGFRCLVGLSASLGKMQKLFNDKSEELRNGQLFLSRWIDGESDNCADIKSVRLQEV